MGSCASVDPEISEWGTQHELCRVIDKFSLSEGRPGELKHLVPGGERKSIPESGERNGKAFIGVVDTLYGVTKEYVRRIIWKVESKKVIIPVEAENIFS